MSLSICSDLTADLHGIEANSRLVAVGWLGQNWIWVDEPLKRWFPVRVKESTWDVLCLNVVMHSWWMVVDDGIKVEMYDGRLDLDEKEELRESCENDCDRKIDS